MYVCLLEDYGMVLNANACYCNIFNKHHQPSLALALNLQLLIINLINIYDFHPYIMLCKLLSCKIISVYVLTIFL